MFSVEVVRQFAKLCYGLGFKTFVVSKPSGAAAQAGVPEAQKIALKKNKVFVVLSGIEDVIELFKPSLIVLITPKKHAKEEFNAKRIVDEAKSGCVVIVFGGSEPGLSAREMEMGIPMHVGIEDDIGPLGFASIVLHTISYTIKKEARSGDVA
ncbi:MAG: RecB-family nuclease [Candidatus Nezhaarchaeota archaeon]|nr:RecB-family nuclease [Candidatus Nezhaarchaeota archaeon]